MKSPKATSFSGNHGPTHVDGKSQVSGKVSKALKDVRDRFFAKKEAGDREKLTPIQRRQASGGV